MKERLGNYIQEYSVRNKNGEDIPVYSVTNTQGFCKDYFGKEVASKDKTTYKIVPRGCFAYNPSRINVGSVDYQRYQDKVIVSSLYNVFTVSDNLDKQYLYYYLKSDVALQRIRNVASGSVRDNLKLSMLYEFPINVRDIEEQRSIVYKLDQIRNIIDLRKKELEQLDELVKARFVELFGDVANCPKYTGVELGKICSTLSGGTPTTKIPEYYQGNIPWISTPYLGNSHINGENAKAYITEDAIKNSATHLIPANTIMFGIRVGVGKSSIIDEPMCANQDIVALMNIDTNKYDLLFIKHVLDAYQNHFDSIKKGATILGITTDDLKKVVIPSVDMELQNQFTAFVEQIDKSKFVLQKALDEAQTLFDSLMQEYFG